LRAPIEFGAAYLRTMRGFGFSMHKVELSAPVISGQDVIFDWRVEPKTALYRESRFKITFPQSIDLSRVPERLWWDILLICLHPHWLLLRPCQVRLPIKVPAREQQFWLQLLQNGADTLQAYGREAPPAEPLDIEFVAGDLEVPRVPIAGTGCGTAFSSGKDSLLQAALLAELTDKPLLVTTTSQLPPFADHQTARRRDVLAAIATRRNVRLVEVVSDFRAICDNGFAGRLGYRVAVSELTDTFIYMAGLLAVGAACGVSRLFMASETEVQDNAVVNGKIVQHSHFMYSAATQRALARLLAPYGIQFGSLTWPLHTMQVQQLLWARYPDLCDLQYSCWSMAPGEATCSRCEQCLRVAVTALASGDDPERMGIDLRKVLAFASSWKTAAERRNAAPAELPQDRAAQELELRVLDTIRRIDASHLIALLRRGNRLRLMAPDTLLALAQFYRLRRRVQSAPPPSSQGVREAFFDWLDPELRASLVAIYTRYFPCEPRARHLDIFERSRDLTMRATSSLE
jgi:hypothetical protein